MNTMNELMRSPRAQSLIRKGGVSVGGSDGSLYLAVPVKRWLYPNGKTVTMHTLIRVGHSEVPPATVMLPVLRRHQSRSKYQPHIGAAECARRVA